MTSSKTLSLIIPSAFCDESQGLALVANLRDLSCFFSEIVCVDFHSSPAFQKEILNIPNLRIIFQSESTGIYGAWIIGLSCVSATHVCFAGVDDLLYSY